MFSIIKNTAFELKERFKTMPFIYILIFSFSLLVFFYEDIPQAFIPTLMLSGAICFFLSDCALSLKRIKKVILAIITFAFMSGVYYIYLTTLNRAIEKSLFLVTYLYFFSSINLYFLSKKHYCLQMKAKIVHILISFALFIATYMCLYFSIFFIYAIFSKSFSFFYQDCYARRIINSLSFLIFFSIFSIYKNTEDYKHSNFFIFVFSKFIPIMLFFFLSLLIIYLAKMTIVFDSNLYIEEYKYAAPLFTFLVFILLLMIQITEKNNKALKLTFALSILSSISLIIFYIKYLSYPYFIHYVLIYSLIAIYFIITLLKTKKITPFASYLILVIIFIYYTPVIGAIHYETFSKEKDYTMESHITTFNNEQKREEQVKKEKEKNVHYVAPSFSKGENGNNNASWVIKNENYSDIIIDMCLTKHNKENESTTFIYANYEFKLASEGKVLIAKNKDKNEIIGEFDLYSIAKTEVEKKNKKQLITFDTKDFKLVLSQYSFNAYIKRANLNVYIYKH